MKGKEDNKWKNRRKREKRNDKEAEKKSENKIQYVQRREDINERDTQTKTR